MKTWANLFGSLTSQFNILPTTHEHGHSPAYKMYQLLWDLYYSDIYENLYELSKGNDTLKTLHPIRNPTYRTVEFYVKHIWPGTLPEALPIDAENDSIEENMHTLWKWSNWEHRKQVFARRYSLLGDEFIKIAQSDDGDRVFMQLISAEHVEDFEVDERDFITYMVTQIPFWERDVQTGERTQKYTVEVWDKETQLFRTWVIERPMRKLKDLGPPDEEVMFSDFGINFVPFVRCKFRDVGELRGVGAVTLAIRKVWEADLIASSLHQRLFRYNKSDWALTTAGADSAGRTYPTVDDDDFEGLLIGEEVMWDLPPGRDIRSLVANIDYRSALAILESHMTELENDIPELAYYSIRKFGANVSGRAVRTLLGDSVAAAEEARANAESTLIRAHMMAFSIGKNAGLFPSLQGTFENGDFEHQFKKREIIPISDIEKYEAEHKWALAESLKIRDLGWSVKQVQRDKGLDNETIELMDTEREIVGDEVGAAMLRAFNSGGIGS